MNDEFLEYYNYELRYLKEAGRDFAREYPGMAGKIDPDEFTCDDPLCERLLESFAFMSAMVRQKLEAGYPRLSRLMLENLFPDFLMPVPSMGIVKFSPELGNKDLLKGHKLKRGTRLKDFSVKKEETCQYRTAHDVMLWPIEIVGAKYIDDMSELGLIRSGKNESCLCLEFKTATDIKFKDLDMDCLEFYLRGADTKLVMSMFRMLLSNCTQIVIQSGDGSSEHRPFIIDNANDNIRSRGFDIEDSLLPFDGRTFEGHRLLRKYFILIQSFMFIQINGIGEALKGISFDRVKIILIFNRQERVLKGQIKKNYFNLFCSPIVNLFEKTLARIEVNNKQPEFHLAANKVSPSDAEIIKITEVKGFKSKDVSGEIDVSKGSIAGSGLNEDFDSRKADRSLYNKGKIFTPLYSASGFFEDDFSGKSYYSLDRAPRPLTEREREKGTRTSYIGTEAYLSIVDQHNPPYDSDLEQLEVKALCSNRDLPVSRPFRRKGDSDFAFSAKLPIKSAVCIYGPTMPYCENSSSPPEELINIISLNSFSLYDPEGLKTAKIIKKILEAYAITDVQKNSLRGIKSIKVTEEKHRSDNVEGVIDNSTGLAIDILFDEEVFGNSFFLLGMILDTFFESAAPVNIFTRTTIKTVQNGIVKYQMISTK